MKVWIWLCVWLEWNMDKHACMYICSVLSKSFEIKFQDWNNGIVQYIRLIMTLLRYGCLAIIIWYFYHYSLVCVGLLGFPNTKYRGGFTMIAILIVRFKQNNKLGSTRDHKGTCLKIPDVFTQKNVSWRKRWQQIFRDRIIIKYEG